MKDVGLVIRTFIEKNKLNRSVLATKAGLSQAHFWQLIQKEDLTCSKLERICEAVGISPLSVFDFDCGVIFDDQKKEENAEDVKSLKLLLKEKQKRIDALEDALASTKELLSLYRDKNGTKDSQKAS